MAAAVVGQTTEVIRAVIVPHDLGRVGERVEPLRDPFERLHLGRPIVHGGIVADGGSRRISAPEGLTRGGTAGEVRSG